MGRILKQPVVWVTGAGRGIGAELAKQFSYIGCRVALSSRTKNELKNIKNIITNDGGESEIYRCDIKNQRQVIKTHKKIVKHFGKIDILINNAGITSFKSFAETSAEVFNSIIQTNLFGAFYCTKQVLPDMMKMKNGLIINIASVAVNKVFSNSAAYSASKAGLVAMCEVMREEVRKFNIKIVSVYPGATATKIWSNKKLAKYKHQMSSPKSIAETILALYKLNHESCVEELTIRPIHGDV